MRGDPLVHLPEPIWLVLSAFGVIFLMLIGWEIVRYVVCAELWQHKTDDDAD